MAPYRRISTKLVALLVLGVLSSVNASRFDVSPIQQKRQVPLATQAEFNRYHRDGNQIWTALSAMHQHQGQPDQRCDPPSSPVYTTFWDFTEDPGLVEPPEELKDALGLRNLPKGASYMRVDAVTPRNIWLRPPHEDDWFIGFRSLYNHQRGVIIIENNEKRPQHAGPLPTRDMSWSQMTANVLMRCYPSARASSENPFRFLRYIFVHMILSQPTLDVINFLISSEDRLRHRRQEFLPGTREFSALLGSPDGQGVGHLLFEHKHAFGFKTIKRITIQKGTSLNPNSWDLIFQVG